MASDQNALAGAAFAGRYDIWGGLRVVIATCELRQRQLVDALKRPEASVLSRSISL